MTIYKNIWERIGHLFQKKKSLKIFKFWKNAFFLEENTNCDPQKSSWQFRKWSVIFAENIAATVQPHWEETLKDSGE